MDRDGAGAQSELIKFCIDFYTECDSDTYRQRKLEEIRENRKKYRGEVSSKEYPFEHCSNVTLGLSAIAVDNIEPRIKAQLMSDEDFIQVSPTSPDDIPKVEYVKEFLHWAIRNNINIKEFLPRFCHTYTIDGTTDVIPIWNERIVTNRKRSKQIIYLNNNGEQIDLSPIPPEQIEMFLQQGLITESIIDTFQEEDSVDFEIKWEIIDIFDVYTVSTWNNFDNQPYCRRIMPFYHELVRLQELGVYKNINEDLLSTDIEQKNLSAQDKGVKHSDYSKQVPLLEFYVRYKDEWRLVTLAYEHGYREVRNQLLRDVYWEDKKPIKRFRLFPEEDEAMGVGLPHKIRHFSKALDDIFNQMIDSGTIEIIPYFFYNSSVDLGDNFEIAPGKGVPIPEDANITFPNPGIKSVHFQQFMGVLMEFFERLIALSDAATSSGGKGAGSGSSTYSGMALATQEGNVKHQYIGEQLRNDYTKLISTTLSLYAQNLPIGAMKRIFANNTWLFEPIDYLSIQGRYDFSIDVSDSSANKMLNRQEAIEMYQALAQNPTTNAVELTKDLIKAYGHKATDKYILPIMEKMLQASQSPEFEQIIDQFLQQKQQEQQQQEIQSQAQKNIDRREAEREIERPLEGRKLYDQAQEHAKRELLKPVVKQQVIQEALGGGGGNQT
jgi:hypothetical protein